MKIFKRLRGFIQRRIPLLRKKQKDKPGETNEGFEDCIEKEISNEVGEFAPEISVEMNGPLEHLNEEFENGNEIKPNGKEFQESSKEILKEGAQFSPNKIVISDVSLSPDRLKNDCKNYKRMTPNKDEFIEAKKVPCPLEKYMLWDGPLVKELDESRQDNKRKTAEKSASCGDEDKKGLENCQLPVEKNGTLDDPWNPENKSDFEVDFEIAFGKGKKESDAQQPWYPTSSKEIENLSQTSKETSYHLLDFENQTDIDKQFDAVFGLEAKSNEKIDDWNDTFEVFPEKSQGKEYCNEQSPIDYQYEFEDDYEELKPVTPGQKKKLMVVIRDRPTKNLAFQKLFLHSDVENMMYIREIKDPLKRKHAVRSDLTGFKHVPCWDSSKMKKYYSDGDLSRPPPDFSMASTKKKE